MTERQALPLRRHAETFNINFGAADRLQTVTLGFYGDGRLGEVFINAGKSGEQVEAIARDGAVLLSIALQYGVPLITIKNAITRGMDGEASSIIGAVVDKLVERYDQ